MSERGQRIAERVEAFVRTEIIPYEKDPRVSVHGHGPSETLVQWSRQYREAAEASRDANMDRTIEWLEANVPREDENVGITHGDFRIDNMIFHPSEPRIVAVLDWELCTLGHPGADFAYHAMMYHVPPHIVPGLGACASLPPGIPDERSYLAAYCARTHRKDMPNYLYYLTFSVFRLAAIFHGIKSRVIKGTASSASATERAKAFPELAEIAWRLTRMDSR